MTDHETVVVTDGRSNSGVLAGIVLVILLRVGIWFFVLGGNGGTNATNNTTNNPVPSLDINLPTLPAAS